MIVIGITGKMYSGKSTVAQIFKAQAQKAFGYDTSMISPFAGPLKCIANQMGWNGVKDTKGRRLLQLLGTECMRECIDPEGWIKLWRQNIDAAYDNTMPTGRWNLLVIADDCRYDNEAHAIRAYPGGRVIQIRTPAHVCNARAKAKGEVMAETGHISEQGVSADMVTDWLMNDGDLSRLETEVGLLWENILFHARKPNAP